MPIARSINKTAQGKAVRVAELESPNVSVFTPWCISEVFAKADWKPSKRISNPAVMQAEKRAFLTRATTNPPISGLNALKNVEKAYRQKEDTEEDKF